MRIHLLCDHKWRDLPNLSAIKVALEALGHRVLLSATRDAVAMIKAFGPDCVVLNHLYSPANQELAAALRAAGVTVVVIPTEGGSRREMEAIDNGEFADDWSMDLFLAWSEHAARGVRNHWGLDDKVVRAIGGTRFDFYSPRFRAAITPRDVFCQRNGLDPARPVITWATA
jgi:surface carbohydrate biosynthesis protein